MKTARSLPPLAFAATLALHDDTTNTYDIPHLIFVLREMKYTTFVIFDGL